MDPVTHTLTGVALGRAGLERATPLAMTALFVGANVPDVDIAAAFLGADASLGFRRGWSHGPVGLLVLPLVLVGALWFWRRLTSSSGDPPVYWGRLTAIAYLAALTHPLLDWLNTYGIRFFMPFSGTWYYGDAVFIVDPWLWLVLAAPVMLAASRRLTSKGLWLLGALAATTLMLWVPFVPTGAKTLWGVAIVSLVGIRASRHASQSIEPIARAAVAVAVVYMLGNVGGSVMAARRAADTHGVAPVAVVMAGPLPANPSIREIIIGQKGDDPGGGFDRYLVQTVNWITGEALSAVEAFPVNDGPEARAAMAAPQVAGYADWARFPTFTVSADRDGVRVDIVDVRYAKLTGDGFGTATVFLDRDLNPLRAEVR